MRGNLNEEFWLAGLDVQNDQFPGSFVILLANGLEYGPVVLAHIKTEPVIPEEIYQTGTPVEYASNDSLNLLILRHCRQALSPKLNNSVVTTHISQKWIDGIESMNGLGGALFH